MPHTVFMYWTIYPLYYMKRLPLVKIFDFRKGKKKWSKTAWDDSHVLGSSRMLSSYISNLRTKSYDTLILFRGWFPQGNFQLDYLAPKKFSIQHWIPFKHDCMKYRVGWHLQVVQVLLLTLTHLSQPPLLTDGTPGPFPVNVICAVNQKNSEHRILALCLICGRQGTSRL